MSIKIDVRNGNLEQAMRVLKKKCLKEGTFRLAKEKSVYENHQKRKDERKKKVLLTLKRIKRS